MYSRVPTPCGGDAAVRMAETSNGEVVPWFAAGLVTSEYEHDLARSRPALNIATNSA